MRNGDPQAFADEMRVLFGMVVVRSAEHASHAEYERQRADAAEAELKKLKESQAKSVT